MLKCDIYILNCICTIVIHLLVKILFLPNEVHKTHLKQQHNASLVEYTLLTCIFIELIYFLNITLKLIIALFKRFSSWMKLFKR